MDDVEVLFAVLLPRFAQHGSLPEQIVQSNSFVVAQRAARVPSPRERNPNKVQIGVRVEFKIAFDVGPESRISHHPNFV
jgi:hypothetical protein